MKPLIALLAAAGLVVGSAAYAVQEAAPEAKAADKAVDTAKPEKASPVVKPVAEKITFAGKVSKEEKIFKGKEDKEMKKVIYKVTAADGSVVYLPPAKKAKEGEKALDYDSFVDKDVTVSGEGFSKEKDGKKKVMFMNVKSIDLATTP